MSNTVKIFLLISIVGIGIIIATEMSKDDTSKGNDLIDTFVGAPGRVELPDEKVITNELKVNSETIKYPSINIEATNSLAMNELILSDINEFINSNPSELTTKATYQFMLNGDVLSILLRLETGDDNYVYKTYIYNTQTDMPVDNNQLFALFDLNSAVVSEMMLKRLNIKEFYNYENADFDEALTKTNDESIIYLNKTGEMEIIFFVNGVDSALEKFTIQITPDYYS